MKTLASVLGLCALLAAGCARHVVVERDAGRVDTTRSVMTNGDAAWKVLHEPSAAPPAAQGAIPSEGQAAAD
jgi:hypothetical protein